MCGLAAKSKDHCKLWYASVQVIVHRIAWNGNEIKWNRIRVRKCKEEARMRAREMSSKWKKMKSMEKLVEKSRNDNYISLCV